MSMKRLPATIIMGIAMTDGAGDFYKLMAWLSPAFPAGAFSHSTGLENAIAAGLVNDRKTTQAWVEELLTGGSLWSDAVIFANAHDAAQIGDRQALAEITCFANALPATAELRMETSALGAAFAKAVGQGWPTPLLDEIADTNPPYPVAVAVTAASHSIDCRAVLGAFIHAAAANLVSVAVRLVPLGQSDGVRLIAALEPAIRTTADKAADTAIDDLTTNCLMADIVSMHHETQRTRLFRT